MNLAPPTLLCLSCLPACASFEGVQPETKVHGISLQYGEREIDDEDELPGLEDLDLIGIEYDVFAPHAALGWELTLLHTNEERDLKPSGSSEVRITELAGGLRKTFGPSDLGVRGLYPYVGAGASLFYTEGEVRSPGLPKDSDEDFDAGLYARVGLYARFADRFRVGVDYRYVWEEFTDFGGFDLDGDQLALTLGVSF